MTWLSLLRSRPAFARLWLAEAVSLCGDWFSLVAVSVLAVEQGGGKGALAVATVLAAHGLPHAVLAPVAGVLADRWDRRRLLIGLHVVQAVLTVLMAVAGAARALPAVQALVLLRASVAAFDPPVRAGAMRRVVAEDELLTANALSGATWSAAFAFGMAGAGALASFGTVPALLADALTFAVAAVLLLPLPAMPTAGGAVDVAGAVRDLARGARVAFGRADLARAVTAKLPFGLAGGAALVAMNLVADGHPFAGTAAASLGWMQASKGVGTGIGPALVDRAVARGVPEAAAWAFVAVTGAVGVGGFLAASTGASWLVASFVWGVGTGSNWMLSSAAIQRLSPDEAVGRVSAIDALLAEGGVCAGALGAGAAIELGASPGYAAGIALVAGVAFGVASAMAPEWAVERRAA